MKQHRVNTIRILLFLYLCMLVKVILFKFHPVDLPYMLQQFKISWDNPMHIIGRMQRGNLVPFDEITRTLDNSTKHGLINLFGNIAIFVPFGILQGILGARKGITAMEVVMLAFAVSLCLESSQAIFSMGTFDVDDLILNTSGGLTGFVMYTLYTKLAAALSYPIRTRDNPI
ncbi:VanZ family protein [Paenibacillus pinihumi]|uniref:VanZ family protein n=1 Tax=Paenibacillus pinihumi TaxID=669462 RepID=UPI00041DF734|nr:VanZ family protein [Paenibacillus pinihumi]